MIPFHDENPVRRTPWVTYTLIVANVIVFGITPAAWSIGLTDLNLAQLCDLQAFYHKYAAIPREMVQGEPLPVVPLGPTEDGAGGPACQAGPPPYDKIPALSVLSAMFLHGGLLHLLGNMLFLWVFGNNIEDRLGPFRFALFYLACGYLAGYGFALANADSTQPLVGASGAVSGVLGAYLVLFPTARIWSLIPILLFIPLRLPAWLVLGTWFALQWVYSAGYAVSEASAVAYLAHVLGFAAGMLFVAPLRGRRKPPEPAWQRARRRRR